MRIAALPIVPTSIFLTCTFSTKPPRSEFVLILNSQVSPDGRRLLVATNYSSGHGPEQTFYEYNGAEYIGTKDCTRTGEASTTACLVDALPELNMWVTSTSIVNQTTKEFSSNDFLVFRNTGEPCAIIDGAEGELKGDPAKFDQEAYDYCYTRRGQTPMRRQLCAPLLDVAPFSDS